MYDIIKISEVKVQSTSINGILLNYWSVHGSNYKEQFKGNNAYLIKVHSQFWGGVVYALAK